VNAITLSSTVVTQSTRTVQADLAREIGPHGDVPLRVVGAGRVGEGLRADWQAQLATVQREIGFHYLRMHGILNDEMGVYTEDRQGNPQINCFGAAAADPGGVAAILCSRRSERAAL
jgi:xylan 1,4-beta-xylosidase